MQIDPAQIAEMHAARELVQRNVLSDVFDRSTANIIVFDARTKRIFAANGSARNWLGRTMRELSQLRIDDLVSDIAALRLRRILGGVKRREIRRLRGRFRADPGSETTFDAALAYHPGAKASYSLTWRDITRHTNAERRLTELEGRLTSAIEVLPDGFVLYDRNDRLVTCNETYRNLYRISAPAMQPGARFEDILRYGAERGQYKEAAGRVDEWVMERLIAHNTLQDDVEQRLGDGRWLRIVERETPDGGRVGLRIDITRLKDQQEALHRIARTDELTGLRNRHELAEDVDAVARRRGEGQQLVLLQLDLNRFRSVNEGFGHEAGDHILRMCGERLWRLDPRPELVARIGGDEFLCVGLLHHGAGPAMAWGRSAAEALVAPIGFAGQTFQIGASAGLAIIDEEADAPGRDAVNAVDIALNQAKTDGGDAIVVFQPEMREARIRRSAQAVEIVAGIARNEFVPFFQPQVDVSSGEVVGFEALIRWLPDGRPPVPALEFLAVAQAAGLSDDLDEIVMRESCRAIRELIDLGMEHPRVSINLSMAQVNDPNLADRLCEHLRTFRVSPEHLRIELLESTLLDERTSTIVRNVHNLISAGFMMELDDFGTGHAAIATLRKFDVSQIKIDRSFVRHIDEDAGLRTITGAMVDLAQKLGISALAEGVETKEEQDVLLGFGCKIAQGYLHARPMPLQELKEFLKDRGEIDEARSVAN